MRSRGHPFDRNPAGRGGRARDRQKGKDREKKGEQSVSFMSAGKQQRRILETDRR